MIGPEIQVPDVTEAVVGYRQFGLARHGQHNYQLVSPHTGDPWLTVECTAKCNKTIKSERVVLDGIRPKQHSAPAKDCGCGIYAYFDPCLVAVYDNSMRWMSMHGARGPEDERVAALVTMTGRIEVHARGMRSAKARICALGMNGNLNADERAALKTIADDFGVPLVPQADLPKLATEFGRPLDDSLRPETEKPKVPAPTPGEAVAELAKSYDVQRARPSTSAFPIWANAATALMQVACWVIWGSAVSLFAMAFSLVFAAYFFGRRTA